MTDKTGKEEKDGKKETFNPVNMNNIIVGWLGIMTMLAISFGS